MNVPSTSPPSAPKSRLTSWLLAAGIVGFLVFAFSFGGLVFWLILRRPVPATGNVAPARAAVPATTAGDFVEIFNGRDLEGWDFDPGVWDVRNGLIHGSKNRGGSLIWRGGEVEDFELRFHFRLVRGNSGVYYRARPLPNYGVGGYEFEIHTNRVGELSDNGPDRTRRNLFQRPTLQGIDVEWHEGVITAIGGHLVHQIDGEIFCDVQDDDPAAPRTGHIVFGNAGGTTVDFKDIRLRRLKTNP